LEPRCCSVFYNPPLPLRPTSVACRSISGCRNRPAKTSSFPLCPDHRPGPPLLKKFLPRQTISHLGIENLSASKKSLASHPDAILSSQISGKRVFQYLRLLTSTTVLKLLSAIRAAIKLHWSKLVLPCDRSAVAESCCLREAYLHAYTGLYFSA
jgi:hypothetical protein